MILYLEGLTSSDSLSSTVTIPASIGSRGARLVSVFWSQNIGAGVGTRYSFLRVLTPSGSPRCGVMAPRTYIAAAGSDLHNWGFSQVSHALTGVGIIQNHGDGPSFNVLAGEMVVASIFGGVSGDSVSGLIVAIEVPPYGGLR